MHANGAVTMSATDLNPGAFVAVMAALLSGCGQATGPSWPVQVQLRLVDSTSEAVFIRAEGDESLYPGIADLASNDSACTTVNADAESVPVEVRSVADPVRIYGSTWIHPLQSSGWRAVVRASGLAVAPAAACSY